MKLLIISNMAHYYRDDQIVGWGPTVEEINHLSTMFESVRHIGCLYHGTAPDSALPYTNKNIVLVPVPPAGGESLQEKLRIIKLFPLYLTTIKKELKQCDVVHLRCPANIPLLALIVLIFSKKPNFRWAKYAGNWNAGKEYPFFYRFQRWILKTGLSKCIVTVNGKWTGQKPFIRTFTNPCITTKEFEDASVFTREKSFSPPYKLLFVGALNERKGVGRLLEIALRLQQNNIPFIFDILGDGPFRQKYEKWSINHRLEDQIIFHGWIPKNKISVYYQEAHLNILPSESEGWPKVLSEGMAYGVVPLAGAVASIPQILKDTGAGIAISPFDNIDGYITTIQRFIENPILWKEYSGNAQKSASAFTYENYLYSVKGLFLNNWNIKLNIIEQK
jgi:glycosyltransferase involved in cell wall biosynthesis